MSSAPSQTANGASGETPLWRPSEEQCERAEMARFMRWAGERNGREFSDYEELRRWSVEELEVFWQSIWEFFGVRASREHEQVLAERKMPGARWFAGAELNYAENMLRGPAHSDGREGGRDPDEVAVLHCSELRELQQLSWRELTAQVATVAAALRALGVGRGDRVVAYMPNVPET